MTLIYPDIILALGLAAVLALLSYKYNALTVSGVIGMVIVGTIVMGLGGMAAAVPLLFFFVSSGVFSKIKTARKEAALALTQKTGARDLGQVMANGGIASVTIIAWHVSKSDIFILAYLAAIAEAAADTWATEIGTLSQSTPYSVKSWRPCLSGESGGITILGLAASLVGAIATALTGILSISSFGGKTFSIGDLLIPVALAGFLGAIFDSIIGAWVQAQCQCRICRKITENPRHCGHPADLTRGYSWINNDIVNWAGTGVAGLMLAIFYIMK